MSGPRRRLGARRLACKGQVIHLLLLVQMRSCAIYWEVRRIWCSFLWREKGCSPRSCATVEGGILERFSHPMFLGSHAAYGAEFTLALQHSGVVSENLAKEVALGRKGGPFPVKPLPDLVISPLGVVPRKEPHNFRSITCPSQREVLSTLQSIRKLVQCRILPLTQRLAGFAAMEKGL